MSPTASNFAPQAGAPSGQATQTLALSFRYQHQLLMLGNASLNFQVAHAQLHARYHSLPPAILDNPEVDPMNSLAARMELDPNPAELEDSEGLTIFGEMVQNINVCISTVQACLLGDDIAGAETALSVADEYVDQAEKYLRGLEVAIDHHVQAALDAEDDPPPPYEAVMKEQAAADWDEMLETMLG